MELSQYIRSIHPDDGCPFEVDELRRLHDELVGCGGNEEVDDFQRWAELVIWADNEEEGTNETRSKEH